MPLVVRRGPVRPWTRLARSTLRIVARAFRVLLVALAAGMGAAPPRPPPLLRQEDPTVQVEEED